MTVIFSLKEFKNAFIFHRDHGIALGSQPPSFSYSLPTEEYFSIQNEANIFLIDINICIITDGLE
jgi:hypothetical protein